jgi:HEPN domain-containing protein
MSDLEHARLLLRLAKDDLTTLEELRPSLRISPAIFGFHAQQAVEKALKAWLSLLDVMYPRVHELGQLFDLLEEHGAAATRDFHELQDLTPFGVQFRYEEFISAEEDLDRDGLLSQVNTLIDFVGRIVQEHETAI